MAADVLESEPLSLFQIIGPSSSTCGYCSPPGQRSRSKSSKSFGIWAHQMSCSTYKKLIDRGWRRSGAYVYKPDMRATCCPQYTIRLEADKFKPGKSQRNILNRFNAFIEESGHQGEPGFGEGGHRASAGATSQAGKNDKSDRKGKGKAKGRNNQPFDLLSAVHSSEAGEGQSDSAHAFQTTLEPASFTDEKYNLYKRYQMAVHGDKESKVTESGFRGFLCDSPLHLERSPDPTQPYGSFHQLYRLDGQLIAIGVLDILPGAVSAVYFIYDPSWHGLKLGKVSAVRECALAVELERKGFEKMYYMMGYYIHTCQKMKYKAEYSPSFLLDPVTYEFLPFQDRCKPILDKDDHAIFSEWPPGGFAKEDRVSHKYRISAHEKPVSANSSTSEFGRDQKSSKQDTDDTDDDDEDADEPSLGRPVPPGFLDPDNLPKDMILQIYTFESGQALPLVLSKVWRAGKDSLRKIREGIAAMGTAAIETCLFA